MISRRILAAIALLWVSVAPTLAQQNKAALTTEVDTNFPDNVIGAITPAIMRSTIIEVINSYYDLNGGTSLACAAHQWIAGLPTLSSLTCTQPAFTDISGQTTLVQLPTIGANTALCSIAGGTPIACSKTQLTTLINLATASLSGALPAWPNNTTTYFRGDGTYATLNVGAIGGFGTGVAAALGNALNGAGGLVGVSGNIGAALGTSLALGGATIGSNALAVTGPALFNGTPTFASNNIFSPTGSLGISDGAGTPQGVTAGCFTAGATLISCPATGILNATVGYRLNSAATSGNVLRGNGTNFVSAQLGIGDLGGYGTGSEAALASNLGAVGAFTQNVAQGTIALGTTAIPAGSCGTASTATATNGVAGDEIDLSFSSDPTATTGYTPAGMLSLVPWVTTNTVNVKQCNLTGSTITPAALSLVWKIRR